MIFKPIFLIFSPKKEKLLKFVSMSAVTSYRSYVQYKSGTSLLEAMLYSTNQAQHQYKFDVYYKQVWFRGGGTT